MQRNRSRRGNKGPGSTQNANSDHRRDQQLCRQAERILGMALIELDDPLLEELALMGVHARGGGTLGVELLAPPGTDSDTLRAMRERIDAARGRLRSELARSINRRRVPDIVISIDALPAQGGMS
jgi:hypothetical protein